MKIVKKILAAVVIAATVASIGATASAATKASGSLYAPIPIGSKQEIVTKKMGGGSFDLNLNAFSMCGYVSTKSVSKYMCDDAYFKVTQNGTGKVMVQGYTGVINDSNEVDVSTGFDSYTHGNRPWIKPATYTMQVWCQDGKHSVYTAAGRPKKVQVCKFTFTVYERGFK